MVEQTTSENHTDTDTPNPVALSVVGGAVGTITGLKRGGLPGAVAGGLVGGTVGYVSAAASCGKTAVGDEPSAENEPISIETADEDATDEDATDEDATDEDDHDDAA